MDLEPTWAIVLAGGDGQRLRSLTTTPQGTAVPKQFCSLDGGPTLLQLALARAERIAPTERILVSVTSSHRPWWRTDLATLPPANIIAQPGNRGTLAGLLLPLLEIAANDPAARLVVFPSDHFVADEVVLETAVRRALADLDDDPDAVVLLGVRPDAADPDYGWIVPEIGPDDELRRISRFVEKPGRAEASAMLARGALLNSFILAVRVWRLVDLCQALAPVETWSLRLARWDASGPASRDARIAEIYARLAVGDVSRDILARCPETLRLRSVPPCGWSDLGTPERVARWTGVVRSAAHRTPRSAADRPALAEAVAHRARAPSVTA